ncbi:MAG: protein kinase domain-containing protein [Planctomycetaceae bacterium]|jgi:serine/threonine protein kinase
MSSERDSQKPRTHSEISPRLHNQVIEGFERLLAGQSVPGSKEPPSSSGISPEMHRRLLDELKLSDLSSATFDPASNALWHDALGADRFEMVRPIASGGMGLVSEAIDREFDRPVALKEILPAGANDPAYRLRFQTEAEITARLDHPGIIPVYSRGRLPDGRLFYTMRLISGERTGTLQKAIREFHHTAGAGSATPPDSERDLAWRGLLRRVIDVCNTMAYAHRQGVLHRDLKPANILLGPCGETLVVDWGLARFVHASPEQQLAGLQAGSTDTLTSQVTMGIGTLAHAAPELLTGEGLIASESTDIYSLGTILYAVLTGHTPFPSRSQGEPAELASRIRAGLFPTPRRVNPGIDPALEAVCLKAMSRDPDRRYLHAEELATDLERALAGESVSAWTEPLSRRLRRWIGRHRTSMTAGAVGLTLLTLGLGFLSWTEFRNRQALSLEQIRLRIAVAEAEQERAVAELERENSRQSEKLAISAVEQFRKLVSGSWQLSSSSEMTVLRNELLSTPLEFYRGLRQRLLSDQHPSLEHLARLRDATRELAWVQFEMGDIGQALQLYDSALAICAKALQGPPMEPIQMLEWQQAQASSHLDRATTLQRANNNLPLQLTEYTLAVELLQPLYQAAPENHQILGQLALAHFGCGHTLSVFDRLVEARTCFETAIRLMQQLIEQDPTITVHRRELANMLLNSSLVLDRLNESAAASQQIQQADAIYESLGENRPENPEYRHRQAASRYNRGMELSRRGKETDALPDFQQAEQIWRGLSRESPISNRFESAWRMSLRTLALTLQRLNNAKEGLPHIQALVQHERTNAIKVGAHAETRGQFLEDIHNLGHMYAQLGQHAKAQTAFTEAYPLAVTLRSEQPDEPRWIYQDIELSIHLSSYAIAPDDLEKACERLLSHVDLARQRADNLAAIPSDRQIYRNLLFTLGGLLERRGEQEASGAYWKEFREFEERDPGAHPLIQRLREVSAGAEPADQAERLVLARASLNRRGFSLASRLYAEALQLNPELGADRQARHRYAAAQASLRTAAEASDPTAPAPRKLRDQAYGWLQQELQAWQELAVQDPAAAAVAVVEWLTDPALDSIRSAPRRSVLPNTEQVAWQELFQAVRRLIDAAP